MYNVAFVLAQQTLKRKHFETTHDICNTPNSYQTLSQLTADNKEREAGEKLRPGHKVS